TTASPSNSCKRTRYRRSMAQPSLAGIIRKVYVGNDLRMVKTDTVEVRPRALKRLLPAGGRWPGSLVRGRCQARGRRLARTASGRGRASLSLEIHCRAKNVLNAPGRPGRIQPDSPLVYPFRDSLS